MIMVNFVVILLDLGAEHFLSCLCIVFKSFLFLRRIFHVRKSYYLADACIFRPVHFLWTRIVSLMISLNITLPTLYEY